jgi:hypothetical protein
MEREVSVVGWRIVCEMGEGRGGGGKGGGVEKGVKMGVVGG